MPGVGQAHPVAAFEVEGLGDHADGQDAALARALGDDRRRAGAGAAAHAGGDEHHVGAVEVLADLGADSSAADMPTSGWAPAPRPWVTVDAELDAPVGLGEGELLGVGVGDDELDALAGPPRSCC